MKPHLFAIIGSVVLLAGCGTAATSDNPLLQTQHDEELADMLANIIIQKDPILDYPTMLTFIEEHITKAKLSLSANQTALRGGMDGPWLSEKETVQGWVLYKNDRLSVSSDFWTRPGLDLHLYLTTVVDPRDVAFPDITAVDVGRIEFPYGALTLTVPPQPKEKSLRSAVLWDTKLNRLYGFAQLSARK